MIFNEHWNQVGKHAFLGASKYSWINYDLDKLTESYRNFQAVERGTELHAFAAKCIELGQKLPRTQAHLTLNEYVNDAIGYRLEPERVLYFSDNAFGTADSITFKNNVLRIHDLKTGATPAHMEQLYVYAAFFCLEYNKQPEDIMIVLRIYQNNEVIEDIPEPGVIRAIMAKIILFDKRIIDIQRGV